MNRDAIAAVAPRWLAIEKIPASAQLEMIAGWVESIMDAIAQDHVEPDAWETLQLARAEPNPTRSRQILKSGIDAALILGRGLPTQLRSKRRRQSTIS